MTAALHVANPYYVSFEAWAKLLIEQLALYNVDQQPTEAAWRDWAASVLVNSSLKLQGLPDPRLFPTWRPWAAFMYERLLQ